MYLPELYYLVFDYFINIVIGINLALDHGSSLIEPFVEFVRFVDGCYL